ncbi:hypothetical protein FSP39_013412 [Pinctada imbricata]|uniref:Deoxynucleoside kinase domain-containing protein n=1 Tax=Pinctada imbricata TaxID=66713 RepID=A0AA88XIQ9_PINIB|nr:hypothetical protein FSP39_013412 [Pinctada imbricata]
MSQSKRAGSEAILVNDASAAGSSSNKKPKKEKSMKVCVEGNIASGKTSFLRYFKNFSNVEVVEEPVHKWRNINGMNALAKMYEDPERWSLTLQTYVQLTMLEQHMEERKQPLTLMERSIYSAKYCFVENLYQSGKMPEIEYHVLSRWFDWIMSRNYCDIDLIVYLKTDPEVILERIHKRCRKEEQTISLSWLHTLHKLHEDWLIHQSKYKAPAEVLVLNANHDIEDMYRTYDEKKNEILCGYA